MDILDFFYFFVPVFGFAALVEMMHFLPFVRRVTERAVYETLYSVMIVFLIAFLVFEISFIAELFFGSAVLHQILEIGSMTIVLAETSIVVRRSVTQLQVVSETKDILEESEKRYRGLIETMNDGFWAVDPDGKTTMVNHRMAEMLGYTRNEIIGRNMRSFLDKKNQKEVDAQEKLRPTGVSSTYEIGILKKSGETLPVLISAAPLFDDKGRFMGSFAVVSDISRRVEMERQIREYSQDLEKKVEERTQELIKARDSVVNMLEDLTESKEDLLKAYDSLKDVDRMKTDIISNISHELRTPITIAKSAIELTREENDPEEVNRFMNMSETALNRLNDLVENLVDVSTIYKGNYLAALETLDIPSLLKESLQHLKGKAEEKKISLKLNVPKTLPKIHADKKALLKALVHIVDNSIKFNQIDGSVEIRAESDGDYVEITIRDTGIGIAPEFMDKIFDSFYQIDPSATREYGGTGIGLALVKAHIGTLKGRVWVESTPGKGSIFHLKIPIEGEKDLSSEFDQKS